MAETIEPALEAATTREFIEAVHDTGGRIFTGQIGRAQERIAARALGEMFIRAYLAAASPQPEIDRLREALRMFACPRPYNNRPDGFEVGQCVDAGECGCVAHVAALHPETSNGDRNG